MKSIKYIHKCIYKDTDQATVRLSAAQQDDEVGTHLQCRDIGPAEAVVRLFEYHTHEEYPPVQRLAVHLEDQKHVTSRADDSPEQIQEASVVAFGSFHHSGRQRGNCIFSTETGKNDN